MHPRDLLLSAEVLGAVVATLLLVGVALLLVTWVRRRRISHGRPLVLCAARSGPEDPWQDHLLRLGTGVMTLHRLGGLSTRPRAQFHRRSVELGVARAAGDEAPELLRRRTCVIAPVCGPRGSSVELCLAQGDYMALRSWTESAPPELGAPSVI